MKILIADFLFANAHKNVNTNFINAISKFAEIDVISNNGFYDDQKDAFSNGSINLLNANVEQKKGAFGARLFSVELMKNAAAFAQKKDYDVVLSMGFETTFFKFGLSFFKNRPLFIFHHKNIDELTNKVKRMMFNRYKNRVYHVVFEDFFRDRLVTEIGVHSDKVFVIPHPVKRLEDVPTAKSYDCVGLCSSNDENFIQEAVNRECDFFKHDIHILLRSKTFEKKNGMVEVITGFLEKEEYDSLMSAGKAVFVPLPETYIYRLSGSIYDALSRGKVVYTTSKYYANEYGRRYPGTCMHVGSVEQLIERLKNQSNIETSTSFEKFNDSHSIEIVSREIESMICRVLAVKKN